MTKKCASPIPLPSHPCLSKPPPPPRFLHDMAGRHHPPSPPSPIIAHQRMTQDLFGFGPLLPRVLAFSKTWKTPSPVLLEHSM